MKPKHLFYALLAFLLLPCGITLHAQNTTQRTARMPLKIAEETKGGQRLASHDDLPLESLYHSWNLFESKWDTAYKLMHSYQLNGLMTGQTTQNYNAPLFENVIRQTNTFDNDGQLIEEIEELWNGTAWENAYRTTSAYDAQGNEVARTTFQWNLGAWDTVVATRNTFTYGANQLEASFTSEEWDVVTRQFDWTNRETYTDNGNNEWGDVLFEDWNGAAWDTSGRVIGLLWHDFENFDLNRIVYQIYSNGTFENFLRDTCSFSAQSATCTSELWSGTNWSPEYKEDLFMDGNDHDTLQLQYIWNNNAWELDGGNQFEYTYGPGGETQMMISRYWVGGQYQNSEKVEYTGLFVGAAAPHQEELTATVFPNPVSEEVRIRVEGAVKGAIQFELMDLQGNLVLSGTQRGGGQEARFKISDQLAAGSYIYRVRVDGALQSGKLIIRR